MVALRKESVDRNDRFQVAVHCDTLVALRKESVDRNFDICNPASTLPRSLSARRAWIEIFPPGIMPGFLTVALRKESVDRNNDLSTWNQNKTMSLSARRAWIEMLFRGGAPLHWRGRSPQGERVYICRSLAHTILGCVCRSPQGERG